MKKLLGILSSIIITGSLGANLQNNNVNQVNSNKILTNTHVNKKNNLVTKKQIKSSQENEQKVYLKKTFTDQLSAALKNSYALRDKVHTDQFGDFFYQSDINNTTDLFLNYWPVDSFTNIGIFINLTSLIIPYAGDVDIKELIDLAPHLRVLYIEHAKVFALSWLLSFKVLVDLTLNDFTTPEGTYDWTFIKYMPWLQELNLVNDQQISDISFLKTLKFLKSLDLFDDHQISDISSLSSLTSLTELLISSDKISDISSLSSLTSLQTLTLSSNELTDISSLSSLMSLNSLNLGGDKIFDLSPLSSLTSLNSLSLNGCKSSNISPLSSLMSLTKLNLNNNQISDVSPLSYLKNLKSLDLSYNNISDVSSFSLLVRLTELSLIGNSIPNTDSAWSSIHNLPNNPAGDRAWDSIYVRNSQKV